MSRTRNALVAGSVAGAATAIATPGAIGVAAAGKAFKIPVVTQVLSLGTLAACATAAACGNKRAKRHLKTVTLLSILL